SLSHALEDAFIAIERRTTAVASEDVDLLLEAVDALRNGVESGAKGHLEPNVDAIVRRLHVMGGDARSASWLDRLTEAQRHRVVETMGAGARAYRLRLSFTRSCRDHDATAQRVVDVFGSDVVAMVPPVGSVSGVGAGDLFVLTR